MTNLPIKTALSLLQDSELCTLTMKAGQRREASWDPYNWCFVFTDTKEHCPVSDVEEWVPACKF